MSSIRKNFILNTLFQVLRLISPLVVTPYVSRVLGVDGIGTFSYTYSIEYYFSMFAVLGTTAYGAREIARLRDEPEAMSHLFWEIWLMAFTTSLISIICWSIVVLNGGAHRLYYAILTFYLLAAMFDISWFYTGLERFPIIVARNIVLKLIEIMFVFLLVKKMEHLYIYFLIMAGGTFLGNVSLWIGMGKNLTKVKWSTLRPYRHLKNTMVYFLPTIATSVYSVLGKTLIGAITKSDAENGIYEQATKIIDVVKAVTIVSLNTVLGPRNSYLHKQGKLEQIRTNIHVSIDFTLMMSIGAVCGIIGVADLFVPLFFGAGYEPVTNLLRFLSPLLVSIAISYTIGSQYYEPVGLRFKSARYLMVGACCSVVLNLILIPVWKSLGAAIGFLISETIIAVLYLINCDGYINLKDLIRISWKKFVAGSIMAAMLLWQSAFMHPVTVNVILLVVVGMGIYFACLLLLGDRMVLSVLKKGYAKVADFVCKRKG
ncbi:MAG: polysaccharide biosynthesis C-terminal domain-containing protein [Oscillospiraceae bacterium]|nr:polysaccharide biosynthesis C-terminal domain-containing protein [Oscillospiraceae bacterium]